MRLNEESTPVIRCLKDLLFIMPKSKRRQSSILYPDGPVLDPLVEKEGELVRVTLELKKKYNERRNNVKRVITLRKWKERLEKEIELEREIRERLASDDSQSSE